MDIQLKKTGLGPLQLMALGFGLIILLGALLLALPMASRDGLPIPPLDALFTSASAACVTGLVVYDTFSQFSLFGQAVILLLIQVGGLGFMAVAVFLSMAAGRRIGLKERFLLAESLSALQLGGVVRFLKRTLLLTAIFEGAGSVILTLRFLRILDFPQALWYGIFHAVSAFCNAGFDLMGQFEPYGSLCAFVGDATVNIVVMALVIIGGIGFVVWNDIAEHGLHFKKYHLHSKVMLVFTGLIILIPAILFYCLERQNTLQGIALGEGMLASLFQVVSPRTAGYNTLDMAALTEGGSLLVMFLMFVGAGPGSTAGGMKLTTLVVLCSTALAYSRGREDVNLFHKRLGMEDVKRAFSGAVIYLFTALFGALLLLGLQDFPIKDALFETFSALGTVGLSTGITRFLNPACRLIVILLMYSGRLGSLSVAMAVTEKRRAAKVKNTEERIIVG